MRGNILIPSWKLSPPPRTASENILFVTAIRDPYMVGLMN